MSAARTLYSALRRHVSLTPEVLPADLFLINAHRTSLPLAEALSSGAAQKAMLRQTFDESTDPQQDLDIAVKTMVYADKRRQGLYGSEKVTDWPAFVLENPVLPGETVEWIFVEPRYLQLAEEALSSTNRFVYMSSAAHQSLPQPGTEKFCPSDQTAVGVLMYVMQHEQRDDRIFAKCLAGPPVAVREVRQTPIIDSDVWQRKNEQREMMGLPPKELGRGEIGSLTRVEIDPNPEQLWSAPACAETKARSSMCLHALIQCTHDQELAAKVRGWVARCGLPNLKNDTQFSFWLAGALAHQEDPAVRQKLLDCSTAERLKLLLPTLQGLQALK